MGRPRPHITGFTVRILPSLNLRLYLVCVKTAQTESEINGMNALMAFPVLRFQV